MSGSTNITLHEKLAASLPAKRNAMTTRELIAEVNWRRRYENGDRTPITDYHVHGRTKSYPQLFDRDETMVRHQ